MTTASTIFNNKFILSLALLLSLCSWMTSTKAEQSVTMLYQGDESNFSNPERGLHSEGSLIDGWGFSEAQSQGYTLVRTYVRLDDYTNSALPTDLLIKLSSGLSIVRQNNVKVVLRFSYNFGFDGLDTNIERVEQHIRQLTPILRDNADVIAVVQAGFIGAWGEWHGSDFGLDSNANKARVHAALAAAVPADRMIQLRTPGYISTLYPSALPRSGFFDNTYQSRTGFHNDCFLSNRNDAGTYPENQRTEAREYLEAVTAGVAVGGETCSVTPNEQRTDCATSIAELDRFDWDYLNVGWWLPVLDRWRNEGCYDEIVRRLGYRFRMLSATAPDTVGQSNSLTVNLQMTNDGFGKLYNPRPAVLILRDALTGAVTRLTAVRDFRRQQPLSGETRSIDLTATIPQNLPLGRYELLVELPDASPSLASNPSYSIRMANSGVWEADSGLNRLNLQVQITDATTADCNLVSNGSVDTNTNDWWSSTQLNITADAYQGAGAITMGAGGGSTFVQAASNVPYAISVFAKSGGRSGWSGLGMDFLNATGEEISESFSTVRDASDYTRFSFDTVTPTGTAFIRFWMYNQDGRTLHVDELNIQEASCG